VRAAARRFLQRNFADGDLAAVVHTSGGTSLGQELTDNRERLLASVDRFMGHKLQSVTLSRIDEYRRTQDTRQQGDPVNDPDDMKRAYDARSSLDVLKGVSEWLAGLRGRRKAILFFSEAHRHNLYDQINSREASASWTRHDGEADRGAMRSNVSFYTIDPRGLVGLSAEMMEIQPVFDDPSLRLDTTGLQSDLQMSQDSLRVLADETSGFAAVNTNDFNSAFARIVKDNSAYYVLGYYPPGQRKDGRFHKLEVKVTRPGLKVRARSGYSTPHVKPPKPPSLAASDTPAVLAEMLDSPLPKSGFPMQMMAGAFRGAVAKDNKARVVLTVELSGDGFKFTEKGGLFHDVLDLSVISVDPSGKPTGKNQKVALDLKPRTHQMLAATGFRVLSEVEVPPGRWQFRVAGRSETSGTAGSVFYDLDVPDFEKDALSLSGLVLTSATAGLVPNAATAQQIMPKPTAAYRRISW
jgi:VWFA-related protein